LISKILNSIAILCLVAAYIAGQSGFNTKEQEKIQELCGGEFTEKIADNIFKIKDKNSAAGYFLTGAAQGYGGPLKVVVKTDKKGNIQNVSVISHKETNSYFLRLKNEHFFDQFKNRGITESFGQDSEVDCVSGATISSTAFDKAVKEAARHYSKVILRKVVPEIKKEFLLTTQNWLLFGLIILGYISFYYKNKFFKYLVLALSFYFVGFKYNFSISISSFGKFILGYLPDFKDNISWWALTGGSLVVIIIRGANIYCQRLCPFKTIQIILNKLSGNKWNLSSKSRKIAAYIPLIFLWIALILILLFDNPVISSYEPFSLLFSLEGTGIQWYLLPASLLGVLFVPSFYCRFFCPVGAVFNQLTKYRTKLIKIIKKKNNEK